MSRTLLPKFKTKLPMNVMLYPPLYTTTKGVLFQYNKDDKSNMEKTSIMKVDGSIIGCRGELTEEDIIQLRLWVEKYHDPLVNLMYRRLGLRKFWELVFNEELPHKPHKKSKNLNRKKKITSKKRKKNS